MDQLFLGLAQLVVALILSGIVAYLALTIFAWFTRDLDDLEELRQGNLAIGMVLGAVIVAVAIILRPALVLDSSSWDLGPSPVLTVILVQMLQLAAGLMLALVSLALSLFLFGVLTRNIDELQELKNGNLAIAAVLSGVAISVALMVSQAAHVVMPLLVSWLV